MCLNDGVNKFVFFFSFSNSQKNEKSTLVHHLVDSIDHFVVHRWILCRMVHIRSSTDRMHSGDFGKFYSHQLPIPLDRRRRRRLKLINAILFFSFLANDTEFERRSTPGSPVASLLCSSDDGLPFTAVNTTYCSKSIPHPVPQEFRQKISLNRQSRDAYWHHIAATLLFRFIKFKMIFFVYFCTEIVWE